LNNNFQISEWHKNDIPTVYEMVIQLAIFEKEPEAVVATLENYYQAFEDGIISGHFAKEKNGKIVGMTLYYEAFSTWKGKMLYLEDFYILSDYRNYGIGQKLFDAYSAEAKKRNCKMLKWQVLDWNEPAIRFYKKNDVEFLSDWLTCRKLI
jgi:GNAT superfamily N-acetyltransferase